MAKRVQAPVTKVQAEGGLMPAFLLLGLWAAFLLGTDTQLLDLKRAWGFSWAAGALLWLAWRAWQGQVTRWPPRALALAAVALCLVYAGAWAYSAYPGAAVFRVELLALGLVTALLAAVLPDSLVERWPWATLACAGLIAAYALLQRIGLDPVEAYRLAGSQQRATGPFGNATFLAAFLVFAWPLVLLWHDTRRPAMLLLLVLALLATQSRAGVLALIVQLAVLCLQAWREGLRPRMRPLLVAGALAGLAALWLFPREQWLRPTLRPQLWAETLRLILQKPWLGWGPGSFPLAIQEHASAAMQGALGAAQFAEHPHNWVLGILYEAGAAGLLAWAFLLALVQPWPVERARRDPLQRAVALGLLGVLVQNLFDRNLDQAAIALCFFFGAGLLARERKAPAQAWPRLAAGFLLVLAVAFAWLGARPVLAYQASVGQAVEADGGSDIRPLREAVAAAPKDPLPLDRLGGALAAQGDFKEALAAFEAAYRLQATAGRAQNAGNCLMELGRPQDAEGRFRLSLMLAPSADRHFSLGYALFKQNRLKPALDELEQALKLDPGLAGAKKLKEQILR